jgi:hypothetical protein
MRLPNESVEKALLEIEKRFSGGDLTLPKHEIVDCGAFCEVFFPHISPKNLLGDFSYRLNVASNSFVVLSRVSRIWPRRVFFPKIHSVCGQLSPSSWNRLQRRYWTGSSK